MTTEPEEHPDRAWIEEMENDRSDGLTVMFERFGDGFYVTTRQYVIDPRKACERLRQAWGEREWEIRNKVRLEAKEKT